jgi:signal transduction histidine kinase
MSQTIEDFRGLFKAENEQENFKLATPINDVIFLLKNNLTDIEIDFNTNDETTIFGYKNELIQVIIILLSNAVEVLHLRQIKNNYTNHSPSSACIT